jgi:recombination protein RecR
MLEKDHPLSKLIEEIKKIPGIGAKSAQRIAFYLIGLPLEEATRLADAILDAKRNVFTCSVCNSLTHVDPCFHCTKEIDGEAALCIVEEPFNIASIEKTGIFKGRYHVLLGTLSPLKGRGPDELKTEKLLERVKKENYQEIIIATNPTVEGEATAHFLTRQLQDCGIRITRLAMGLPVGSDIDFADQVTIKKSLEGRTEIKTD